MATIGYAGVAAGFPGLRWVMNVESSQVALLLVSCNDRGEHSIGA